MKKELIIFLLLVPLASATVDITGPDKDTYNLGDQIDISGYVFRENSFDGFFNLILNCGNTTYQLPRASISIAEGEKKNFPSDFFIPKITLSSSMQGICYIEASLLDTSNNIVESATSDTFEISRNLLGAFSIEETKVQVGRILRITGTIKKLNNQPTDGSIEVYFKRNDTKYLAGITNFKDGNLNYEYQPVASPAGIYSIDLLVNDVYGNNKLFENVVSFTLVDEIFVFSKTDKSSAYPGEKIRVFGESKTILQEEIASGNVVIELDNNIYKTSLKNSKFDYSLIIPLDIKTGKHTIVVKVDDKLGNKGFTDSSLYINAVPTKIEILLNKNSYTPGEKMEITPTLYDQADDPINEIIKIEVLDSENEILLEKNIKSDEKETLEFSDYALPGEYTVKATSKAILKEVRFIIEEVSQLQINLVNTILEITNTGNIKYNKPFTLNFNDGKYIITKRDTLKPNETLTLDLTKEVPSGEYSLIINTGEIEKEFEDIRIIGKSEKSFDLIFYILFALFILIIAYNTYIKSKKGKAYRYEYKKGKEEGKAKLKKIKEQKKAIAKKPQRFGPPTSESERKKHIEDFRKRILVEIKATQEKEKKLAESKKGSFNFTPVPERKIEPKENSNNMFKMFD